MMNLNVSNSNQMSDDAIIKYIGAFIKQQRLDKNMTQQELADKAGINRTTLYEFEQGRRCQLLTLIQILRTLDLFHVLKEFEIIQQISPMELAELEMKKRKRASTTKSQKQHPKSDW